MSTHDYVIDNASGISVRNDLNTVLQAIVSNNSSATEPTTTYAYMLWADTTSGILKQRDSSNLAWIDIWDLVTGGVISIDDLADAINDNVANNMAFGDNALTNNTTGTANTAITSTALQNNTVGSYSTAVGYKALQNSTIGSASTAIGALALTFSTTGTANTALGSSALQNNTVGSYNTAVGYKALQNNTTGSNNTAVGENAGLNTQTSNYNITIGAECYSANTTGDYITMGKGSGSDRIYNQFTTNATWTRSSDKRVKKEIKTNNNCGLDFINDLRTTTYKFRAPSELPEDMSEYNKDIHAPSHTDKMYGFIAQEVKEALDKHNITDFAGHHQIDDGKDNMQGISYEMFVMPLVKGMQELSAKVDDLTVRLEALEDK